MAIKFNMHQVVNTATGAKARVRYYTAEGHVEIMDKDYGGALVRVFGEVEGVGYRNDTDSMTDYFCKGSVRIVEGHALYAEAKARSERNDKAREVAQAARTAKR
jgi:hypothetical protein